MTPPVPDDDPPAGTDDQPAPGRDAAAVGADAAAPPPARRRRWPWWHRRSTAFRRSVRTTLAVLGCGVVALVIGVQTASFTGSLGPHVAQYSTTLNDEVAIDMGPLGAIVIDSPLPLNLGVDVQVKEIPVELTSATASPIAGLTSDLASYSAFLAQPELAVREAAQGIVLDALGRTTVVWALLLTTLALGRLASHGVLRSAVRGALRQPGVPAVTIGLVVALVAVPTASALQGSGGAGRPSAVLAGTPLQEARITGRLGLLVDYYGQFVIDAIDENEAFYAQVEDNLRAQYAADAAPLRPAALPPPVATVDPEELETLEPAAAPVEDATVPVLPADPDLPAPEDDGGAEEEGTDAAGATGTPEQTTAEPADQDRAAPDPVTMLVVSDLHCNVGMGRVIGAAVELSGADVVLNTGDTVMGGTSVESVCVNSYADGIGDDVPVVVANGNHDSETTADQGRARGWTVLRGEPVEVEGVRFLGDTDPTLTSLGQPTQLVRDEPIPQMGQRLGATACEAREAEDPVDIVLVHNPIAARAALDAGCVPLAVNSHLHRRVGPWQRGYGWQYLAASTSGATSGTSTIGELPDPAQMTVIRWDRANRVPMDFRIITLGVDRSAVLGPWEAFPALSPEPVRVDYPPLGQTPWDPVDPDDGAAEG